ncbi:hypothetical protein LCGC14_1874400 [marine sediment metagenome]|uniref:Cardiolipin synthase N-terminal domain-containing protein n=1 Tax=marine sediment metagenome TaxID=412755 RepID=A0A0F9GS73_9ZZZZ
MILHTYSLSLFHWIFMVVGGIVLIVLNLFIAKYIHKDAIRRGIKNSEFWLLIGFILGVLGLLLYFLVRKNYDENQS